MPSSSPSKSAVVVVDGQCSMCKSRGKRTYYTTFRCTNCGLEGEMVHSLTHEKGDARRTSCPRCECRSLQPGDYLVRDSDLLHEAYVSPEGGTLFQAACRTCGWRCISLRETEEAAQRDVEWHLDKLGDPLISGGGRTDAI